MNKTGIVIPVYNHPQGIAKVCKQLQDYDLPCLLIDDGSDPDCRRVLDSLAEQPWIELLRFDKNRGKGAAVCAGLLRAHELGWSHAIQVDADGQHDLHDIPAFLQASQADPQAIVTGDRTADGISAARHYGRKLTDWLVWLQTLSLDISDSMCGYRLYPLDATLALLAEHQVGQRMDFDTDILVRLYWRGTPVKQVKTRVIYREGIPSHFKMVRDNLRLTRMHTLLVLGMLWRLPTLLSRKGGS